MSLAHLAPLAYCTLPLIWSVSLLMAPDIAERIESVYLALTGRATTHGARSWFAREARVRPGTVSRWLSGRRSPNGRCAAVLAQLEARAAHLRGSPT